MFLQAYGTAAIILAMAIVLGRAICSGGGRDQHWFAAPAVGLAALIVLDGAAIKLPGRAVTAAVITALVLVGCLAVLIRRRQPQMWLADAGIAGLALLGASIPFLANGRIGLLGVSVDNDMSWHLLWAEALRSPRMERLWPPSPGYPLGPHSVVAVIGTATGAPLDMAFVGLLLAVVPVTALTAAGVVSGESLWRRAVVGVLCSLTYLVASYYAESAFKETIMAALLLGFVVHLEQASPRWSAAKSVTRWWLVAPAVLLAAGAVYTYSYIGLAWFGASLAVWLLALALRNPRAILDWFSARRRLIDSGSPRRWRIDAGWACGVAVLAFILVAPVIGPILTFFRGYGLSASATGAITTSNLGNLPGPLSPYEMFGLWPSADFRLLPTNVFHAGAFAALAVAAAVYGAIWSVRRGKLLLPAAVGTCWLIWWRVDRTQSPYVSAKALVIGAPLVMALVLGGLLSRRREARSTATTRLLAAAAFCALAGYSTYQELRHQPVQAPESARELAAFEHKIGDSSVLFLGSDEFATWELRPAAVSGLFPPQPSLGAASARPGKPYVVGQPLDFDSVSPADLDHFAYVITSNTPYASEPPPNFRLVQSFPLYELWQRIGPTQPREVIEQPGAPGAVLRCSSPLGERLRRSHGIAGVTSRPLTFPGPSFVAGGRFAPILLRLPPGRWELSIQYISSFNFDVTAQGQAWSMPAYLGRQGPFFAVGAVTGQGVGTPVIVTVGSLKPSFLTGTLDNLFTYIPTVAATLLPDLRRTVPLSQACGKYVDWYRLQ